MSVHLVTEKFALVDALACMTNLDCRKTARRFLEGLSRDELQYIAAFLGARLLDPALGAKAASRNCIAKLIAQYEWNRRPYRMASPGGQSETEPDTAHKMILLLEYLSMSRLAQKSAAWLVESGTA